MSEIEGNQATAEEAPSTQEESEKKVEKKDHKELMDMGNQIQEMHLMGFGLEVRKQEVVGNVLSLKTTMDNKAKESLLNAGISEADLEKYKIDLQTGAIVKR